MKYLTKLVRYLTKWAWRTEADFHESAFIIKRWHAEPGMIEVCLEQDPSMAEWAAQCFAMFIKDAPNYNELKFDLVAKQLEPPQWITVTVQRGTGKTPHELKREAEDVQNFIRKRERMLFKDHEALKHFVRNGLTIGSKSLEPVTYDDYIVLNKLNGASNQ